MDVLLLYRLDRCVYNSFDGHEYFSFPSVLAYNDVCCHIIYPITAIFFMDLFPNSKVGKFKIVVKLLSFLRPAIHFHGKIIHWSRKAGFVLWKQRTRMF